MSKPPTPQGISRLLRKAGFERSTYGSPGVMWNEATPGYSVWATCHQDAPRHRYVAVQYIVGRQLRDLEDWPTVKAEMLARLGEYRAVIHDAGYPALVRDRGKEPPWLTIMTVVAAGEIPAPAEEAK